MKRFWAGVLKYSVKLALFAAAHKDEVIAVVEAVQAAKKK